MTRVHYDISRGRGKPEVVTATGLDPVFGTGHFIYRGGGYKMGKYLVQNSPPPVRQGKTFHHDHHF